MALNRTSANLISPKLIGLLGILIACCATLTRGIENTSISDATFYINQATNMLRGWAWMQSNPGSFGGALGFSSLIALAFHATGNTSLFVIKLALAMGHGASTYLVAKIGVRLGLRKRFWVAAALLFALDPFVLIAATDIQTESIVTLIVLSWALTYLTPIITHDPILLRVTTFILSGFIAILIRPNMLVPFLLIAVLIFLSWIHQGVRIIEVIAASALFVTLLSLFEIIITRLYGGYVFLATNGGFNMALTCRKEFIPQQIGFLSASENTKINVWWKNYLSQVAEEIAQKSPNLSIPQLNHEFYNEGLSYCLSHPAQSLGILILKSVALWRPYLAFGAYNFSAFMLSLFIWIPLTAITFWYVLNKKLSKIQISLRNYFIVMSIGFTTSLLVTPTQIRHRIAFAEPFYWLFLATFLHLYFQKRRLKGFRGRREGKS